MSTTVCALSGDAELLEQLASGLFEASVHSVFDRVINLHRHQDGELCTVGAAGVDDAPATLVTDLPTWVPLDLRVGEQVRGRRGRILLPDGHVVDLRSARAWEPTLPALPMPAASIAWLRDFIVAEGVHGGATADGTGRSWDDAVAEQISTRLDAMLRGIRNERPTAVARAARRLVGLGTGLTPSGDDVLLGVSLVTAMPRSALAFVLPLLRSVIEACAPGTNDISRAALVQAARGRTRQCIIALLTAMTQGDDASTLDRHGRAVTAIGHTSGTDILVGISAALTLESELRGER